MAKRTEYELAIKIAGEIEKSFYNSTKLTKKELNSIARSAVAASNGVKSSFTNGFDDATAGVRSMGKVASKTFDAMTKAATIAATTIAVVAASSVAAGIEFESAFAGVKKTTDATAAEYKDLKNEILDMTNSIPATGSAIAEVAESAGQLGIAKDNLIEFSGVMIDLGESTNLAATEAASSLAKFANITNMATDKYDELGSVIVELGNNFATTEADIVNMATNMASSGELAGLSEANIMAIATAISSVGIEAEAGGSSMSKLLKQIQVAVETGNGSLNDFSSVAGLTTKEFSEMFKTDAVGALSMFIDGLNDVERNGKSAVVILDEMDLKEVRLSNTILSLANADGVLSDAVKLSNEAWIENTALSEEAGKRYETTASQLSILKNGVTGMGIKMYDELNEPIREGIGVANDFVADLSKEVIPELENFASKIPTTIRKTKEFTKSFAEFVEPVVSFGGWLLKHPNLITSTLIGIGSAIATYKVASGVISVGKAFASLGLIFTNPLALAITGVALAIGGAAGLAAYVSKANAEMKKQNLADHFGNITLSIDELSEVAKHIIKNKNLDKLQEALSAFEDMDKIVKSIDDVTKDINRMNWKVSIGMELTDEEKENYQSSVMSFISDTQELALQSQYAIGLNLQVLTDTDAEGNSIREGFDAFYLKNYETLTGLGTQLQEAVNKAFEDGLLSIDEIKEITELQRQMANITEKLAQSKFESQLDVLGLKYSGGDLDAESFQNLQSEIATQVEAAVSSYDEALQISIASAKVRLDEKDIDLAEYNNIVDELKENYLEQVGAIEIKASSFQMNTIMDQYSDELSNAMPKFQEYISNYLDNSMTEDSGAWTLNASEQWVAALNSIKDSTELDSATQSAIQQLLDNMEPSLKQMESLKLQYEKAGQQVPKSITDGLNDAALLSAMLGDESEIIDMMAEHIAGSKELTDFMAVLRETGNDVPEEIAKAIENNKEAVKAPIDGIYAYSKQYLNDVFGKGLNLSTKFNIKANPAFIGNIPSLPGHADGGIFTKAHIAAFAEKGPEAAIPLDGSKNAVGLWKTVGKLLGTYTEGGNSDFSSLAAGVKEQKTDTFGSLLNRIQGQERNNKSTGMGNITYSPNFNFYGEAPSKEDIVEASRISQEEFDEHMDVWFSQNRRLKFT